MGRRRTWPLVVVGAAIVGVFSVLIGCDLGVQRGQSVVTASQVVTLLKPEGVVVTFAGKTTGSDHQVTLLRFLVVCEEEISVNEESHQRTTSSFSVAAYGKNFPVTWNRVNDELRVSGKEFVRSKGDGLLLLVRSSDEIAIRQVKLPRELDSAADLVAAFKQHMGDDPLLDQAVARP